MKTTIILMIISKFTVLKVFMVQLSQDYDGMIGRPRSAP